MFNSKFMKFFLRALSLLVVTSSFYLLVKLSPVLGWIWAVIKAVLTPLLISIIIAYLLNPIVTLLQRRNVPRGIAVFIIYFSFSLFFIVLLMNLIPAFLRQSKDLAEHIPELIRTYQGWLSEIHTHKYDLPSSMRNAIDSALVSSEMRTTQFFSGILDGAGDLFQKLLNFLVIPFIVFYLLKDMEMLQRTFLWFVPRTKRKEATKLFQDIDRALGNYIGGQLLVCGIVGCLAYTGYWLIDMPYALILAVFITVTNIIPYVGPLIGAAPSILLALTISWKMTLFVLVVNLVVQMLEGNLISPMVMGKRLQLHPLLIIIALLLGGEIAGLVGLIFAVPIVAVLRVISQHVILHMVKH